MLESQEVRLTVAAVPELLRVARLTVAVFAGRLGFDLDEVEDLKIAVDEACFTLVGPDGREGLVSLVYRVADDELVIEASIGVGDTVPPTGGLSAQVLGAVVDEHTLSTDGDAVRFRLVKRRTSRAKV